MTAKDLLNEYRPSTKKAETGSRKTNAILLFTALFFFNLLFVLGPVIGVIGIFAGLWAAALALLLTPLAVIGSLFMNGFEDILLFFFVSLITCSLGILLSVGLLRAGGSAKRMMTRYVIYNGQIVNGKGESAA